MNMSYCTFTVSGSLCAIAVERVREVVGDFPCTPVPLADVAVSGLINLRGQIVTAIDLRVVLGVPEQQEPEQQEPEQQEPQQQEPGDTKNHVIVDVGDEHMSLIVDGIGAVMTPEKSMIEPPPAKLNQMLPGMISGIARMPDCILIILNLDSLLHDRIGSVT